MSPKNSLSIPFELMPYFIAIFPHSKEHKWITHVYQDLIIPYIENLIEKIEYAGTDEFEKLFLIKYYFQRVPGKVHNEAKQKTFSLYLGLNSLERISWDFENSFFSAMRKNEMDVSINAFLPANFSKHLKSILKLQLLISLKRRLFLLFTNSKSNNHIKSYMRWIDREIQTRTVSNVNKYQTFNEKESPYYPNRIWYFFNGANRLWLFLQLELLKIKEIVENWKDQVIGISKEGVTSKIILLPLSSIKFSLDLFILFLMPYRLLRTIVNELTNYFLLNINDLWLKHYFITMRDKSGFIINLFIQIGIYLGLTLCIGLSILPIPQTSLVFFSYVPWISLGHFAITIFSSLIDRMYVDIFQQSNSTELKRQHATDVDNIFYHRQYKPHFNIFCERYSSKEKLKMSRADLIEEEKTSRNIVRL